MVPLPAAAQAIKPAARGVYVVLPANDPNHKTEPCWKDPRVLGVLLSVALVVCVVPGGFFDRFFAACAEEFKKGEPEMPLLVKLAAEYGIEFQSGPSF